MNTKPMTSSGEPQNLAMWLLNKKNWLTHALIVALISVVGLVYLGQETYSGAPPLVDYVTADGQVFLRQKDIERGKEVFHLRGLMAYGSFWGDGADRGPDFSADALHRTGLAMCEYYTNEIKQQNGVQDLTDFPHDTIEWIPFIEAYAYSGDNEKALELAAIVADDPYYRHQVCAELSTDSYQQAEQFPDGHLLLVNEFCQPGSK